MSAPPHLDVDHVHPPALSLCKFVGVQGRGAGAVALLRTGLPGYRPGCQLQFGDWKLRGGVQLRVVECSARMQ